MIDPALLRDNPEAVKRSQIARGRSPESVDAAIAAEAQRRAALTTFEELRAEQKAFGKQVAQASKEDKPALVAKAQELAQAVKDAQAASNEAEDAYRAAIDGIENIVLDGVPAGGEENFVTLREVGAVPTFDFEPRDHLQLGEMLGAIDMARGAKVSGARFYFLTGIGARLEIALMNYALDTALKNAQAKGYAERNPEADVEGYDACRKIAILSSLAYGKFLNYENIYTEGITKITPVDMAYAADLGMSVKLLATSRKIGNDSFYAMVAPFLVGKESPLYSVNDVFNAVFVHGNVLGDAMFYGSGAGKLPTASAVVADIVDEAKHLHRNIMTNWTSRPLELMDLADVEGRFFVRVKEATVTQVEEIFGNVQIVNLKQFPGEFAFITSEMKQGEYEEKVKKLNGRVITMIRVKD